MFIVEDMKENYSVPENDKWNTEATVAQDLGQSATGTTSTTIIVEATDEVPASFYGGTLETEDGLISFLRRPRSLPLETSFRGSFLLRI